MFRYAPGQGKNFLRAHGKDSPAGNPHMAVAPQSDGRYFRCFTLVSQPPTFAPSSFRIGLPRCRTAKSVVVPPISTITPSSKRASAFAPIRLAAGPERIVSIGFSRAVFLPIRLPSPFTIRRGALQFFRFQRHLHSIDQFRGKRQQPRIEDGRNCPFIHT